MDLKDLEYDVQIKKKPKIIKYATDQDLIYKNSFYILTKLSDPEQNQLKVFSNCWLAFTSHKMDYRTYKSLLKNLDTKLIPFLQDPRLLADFLVDAYNQGGIIGILALNGLFTLITKYDL